MDWYFTGAWSLKLLPFCEKVDGFCWKWPGAGRKGRGTNPGEWDLLRTADSAGPRRDRESGEGTKKESRK